MENGIPFWKWIWNGEGNKCDGKAPLGLELDILGSNPNRACVRAYHDSKHKRSSILDRSDEIIHPFAAHASFPDILCPLMPSATSGNLLERRDVTGVMIRLAFQVECHCDQMQRAAAAGCSLHRG